jgi:hypothetical protein
MTAAKRDFPFETIRDADCTTQAMFGVVRAPRNAVGTVSWVGGGAGSGGFERMREEGGKGDERRADVLDAQTMGLGAGLAGAWLMTAWTAPFRSM